MALAVITVNSLATPLDKKFQEVRFIARALDLAENAISAPGGAVTSGNLINDGGVVIGTWVYSPQAAS
jgi:hypothetical protein